MTPTIRYDPLDRVIRTDFPDGTISRVEFDAWRQEEWDQNDTVLESEWYAERGERDATDPEPSDPRERAAWLAAQHAGSPTVVHLDTLGRPFLSVAHNVTGTGTSRVHEFYRTRTEVDIQGNTLSIYDARQHETDDSSDDLKGPPYVPYATIAQRFDVLGRRLRVDSPDAGSRLTVQDAAGKPLRQWDSRGQTMRWQYDELQRPTHMYVAKGTNEPLVQRTVYGEALDDPNAPTSPSPAQDANLRGQAHLVFDGAGLLKSERLDFKGNLLKASRRLATAYQTTPTWDALATLTAPGAIEQEADSESLLEAEVFTTEHEYDALNRVTGASLPASGSVHPNLTRPRYNEAGLLDEVRVSVRGATEQLVVKDIEYNARGQRLRCEHADPGTGDASFSISYEYDPETFRLTDITTRRTSDEALLQKLEYTYDAVGNITEVRDTATWDSTLANLAAPGHGQYRYDALYRLVFATGREHPGQQPAHGEPPRWDIPHGNDLQGVEAYREHIEYDPVGNIVEMRHLRGTSSNASWRRRYKYAESSNRLVATSLPGDQENEYTAVYEYEDSVGNDGGAHGSMTHMPHLDELHWDYADRLQHTIKSNGSNQHTYFTYDASGERVRKVYEHNNLIEERIYLGGVEVYRRRSGVTLELERETLHVMDDQRRVAMVETKLADPGSLDPAPLDSPRWRFQLDNHLGSSALELDHEANVIRYEEYHPYGSTAFHTAASGAGVSRKRYRYTGKERDEETDLDYHGARYYAPWLGRWTAADPLGLADGLNLYRYSRDNPVMYSDPGGTQSASSELGEIVVGGPVPEVPPLQPEELAHLSPEDAQAMWDWWYSEHSSAGTSSDDTASEAALASTGGQEGEQDDIVGAPGLFESLIPLWGSGRSAIHHFQQGEWGWGVLHTGLAVTDVFLVKSLVVAGGKLLTKSVAKAAGKEAAEVAGRNVAGGEGLKHLTSPAAKEAIEGSGKLGGEWGLFALESAKVPASQAGRRAATLVSRAQSAEIKIGAEASAVFARPPRFGPFSASRHYLGVRSSPLGSLNLRTGEFVAGEILKGGVFRQATRGEYAAQIGHQWLLDYGYDALIYTGAKLPGIVERLDNPASVPQLWFNMGF